MERTEEKVIDFLQKIDLDGAWKHYSQAISAMPGSHDGVRTQHHEIALVETLEHSVNCCRTNLLCRQH